MCIELKNYKYFKVIVAAWLVGIFSTLYCLFKICYYTCMMALKEDSYEKADYTLKQLLGIRLAVLILYVLLFLASLMLLYGLKTVSKEILIKFILSFIYVVL
ncbi:uncharacterized protein LOC111630077 [Centruroides sculpturatus]|uniref:uncharacterized protein LOC111630077 n=1 Tax=Centruroides sculpturatus TaxID=218467 RepID=UPI000C6E924F|nr:uncharacterized protein LOC111630077 [Centruroides sculpturatus]